MPALLIPQLSDEHNLGGPVIENSMTLGQLRLLARCVRSSLTNRDFHQSLTEDELEEATVLAEMFEDPELATADSKMHHGFCL